MEFNMVQFMARFMDDPQEDEFFKVADALPLATNGPWLAGGAVRRTLLRQPLDSDFDIFFANQEQLSTFCDWLETVGATLLMETEHHKTFRVTLADESRTVQCIRFQFYGSVTELLDSFDFTITQFAYDGETLYCGDYSLWDLARKRLALHKLTFGVSTLRRLIKYTRQGFTACGGGLASILEQAIQNPEAVRRDVQYID